MVVTGVGVAGSWTGAGCSVTKGADADGELSWPGSVAGGAGASVMAGEDSGAGISRRALMTTVRGLPEPGTGWTRASSARCRQAESNRARAMGSRNHIRQFTREVSFIATV